MASPCVLRDGLPSIKENDHAQWSILDWHEAQAHSEEDRLEALKLWQLFFADRRRKLSRGPSLTEPEMAEIRVAVRSRSQLRQADDASRSRVHYDQTPEGRRADKRAREGDSEFMQGVFVGYLERRREGSMESTRMLAIHVGDSMRKAGAKDALNQPHLEEYSEVEDLRVGDTTYDS